MGVVTVKYRRINLFKIGIIKLHKRGKIGGVYRKRTGKSRRKPKTKSTYKTYIKVSENNKKDLFFWGGNPRKISTYLIF